MIPESPCGQVNLTRRISQGQLQFLPEHLLAPLSCARRGGSCGEQLGRGPVAQVELLRQEAGGRGDLVVDGHSLVHLEW